MIEERRHVVQETRQRLASERMLMASRDTLQQVPTDELQKSTSTHALLQSRFGGKASSAARKVSTKQLVARDHQNSIMSSSSLAQPKAVLLTDVDQKHIDLMRVRNERYTQKLIAEQTKKERFQSQLIQRSQKHEQNKQNLEEAELDRKEVVQLAQERRQKQLDEAIAAISQKLREHDVLFHCEQSFHRAPAVAAAAMQRVTGMLAQVGHYY